MANPGDYRTMRAAGQSAIEVEGHVINELSAAGDLEIRRLGPGRLGVYRTYRPTWALILAIVLFPLVGVGLLFLLVKKSDQGEILIVDGPTGPQVTLPPVVPAQHDAALADRFAGRAGTSAARPRVVGNEADSVLPPPPVTAGAGSPEQESRGGPITAVPGTHQPAIPVANLAPPPPATSSEPFAMRSDDFSFADDLNAATLQRPSTSSVPNSPVVRPVALRFAGGVVSVPPGTTVVLGRAPEPQGSATPVRVPGDASTVSKSHALVRAVASGLEVSDLGSTNGSTVEQSGRSIVVDPGRWHRLEVGDRLVLGAAPAMVELA